MSLRYGLFDSTEIVTTAEGYPVGDKAQSADFFAKYFSGAMGNGVPTKPSSNFLLITSSGMATTLKPGGIYINGYMAFDNADATVTFDTSESAQSIYVIFRLDTANGQITLIKDTALTRTEVVYDLAVARVDIPANVVAISNDMITDLRSDSDYCGYISKITDTTAADLQAAIDAGLAARLPLAGGTITGTVTLKNNVSIIAENASGAATTALVRDASNDLRVGSYDTGGGNVLLRTSSDNAVYHQVGSSTMYQILDANNAKDLHDHQQLYRVGGSQTTSVYINSSGTLFVPDTNGVVSLGTGSQKWNVVYAATATINTSDAREKRDIADITQAQALVMAMQPRQYKFNDGERTHYGFVAQEFEGAMATAGIDDCAALIKAPVAEDATYSPDMPEDEYTYGLRYSELIAPLLAVVQEQQRQIEAMAARLDTLEVKVNG